MAEVLFGQWWNVDLCQNLNYSSTTNPNTDSPFDWCFGQYSEPMKIRCKEFLPEEETLIASSRRDDLAGIWKI